MNPLLVTMLVKIVELSIPYAEELVAKGIRAETLTFDQLYGRSTATLRAEVDAESRRRDEGASC